MSELSENERIAAAERRIAVAERRREELVAMKAELATALAENETLKAKAGGPDPLADMTPEARATYAEARASYEQAQRVIADANAQAEALRVAARRSDFRAMAAAFPNLPITQDRLGEILLECADKLKPEAFAELRRVLKAADYAAAVAAK